MTILETTSGIPNAALQRIAAVIARPPTAARLSLGATGKVERAGSSPSSVILSLKRDLCPEWSVVPLPVPDWNLVLTTLEMTLAPRSLLVLRDVATSANTAVTALPSRGTCTKEERAGSRAARDRPPAMAASSLELLRFTTRDRTSNSCGYCPMG